MRQHRRFIELVGIAKLPLEPGIDEYIYQMISHIRILESVDVSDVTQEEIDGLLNDVYV